MNHRERAEKYHNYMASEAWERKRQEVFSLCRGICQRCKCLPATQVHHKTYARVGDEKLTDLKAVCNRCHEWIHGKQREWDADPALHDPKTTSRILDLHAGIYSLKISSVSLIHTRKQKTLKTVSPTMTVIRSSHPVFLGRTLIADLLMGSDPLHKLCVLLDAKDTSNFIGREFEIDISMNRINLPEYIKKQDFLLDYWISSE